MQPHLDLSPETEVVTLPPKRVIISGGRDWKFHEQRRMTYAALDKLHQKHNFGLVIHGAAIGADSMAGDWARSRNIPVQEFPANWYPESHHGSLDRGAGHKRNQQMLDEGFPDLVIAFPGGPGTKSMMDKSRAAGVPVLNLKNIKQWWIKHPPEHETAPSRSR